MKKTIAAIIMITLLVLSAQAQSPSPIGQSLRLLEERIEKLERDLERYKKNYADLNSLFLDALNVLEKLHAAGTHVIKDTHDTITAARTVEKEIDKTVAESKEVISYLKNNVTERPTLLVTGEAGWHVLLGVSAGAYFTWEPVPWLGLKAGAELWYTDVIRPAFPLAVSLRLGLN